MFPPPVEGTPGPEEKASIAQLVGFDKTLSGYAKISGLVRAARCSTGTPARFKRTGLLVQLSGMKRRKASIPALNFAFGADFLATAIAPRLALPPRLLDRQARSYQFVPSRDEGQTADTVQQPATVNDVGGIALSLR
jgi:hypothetical protein